MGLHNRNIRQDVHELGALLGDTLEAQTSTEAFDIVEKQRTTAIAYRNDQQPSREPLRDILDSIDPDTESIVQI